MGLKCASFGIQGDASFKLTAGTEFGIAFTFDESSDLRGYASVSTGVGMGLGLAGSVMFGVWTVEPKNLSGKSIIISFGLANIVGIEFHVILSTKFKFLGFQIGPNYGNEINFAVSMGGTTVFDPTKLSPSKKS